MVAPAPHSRWWLWPLHSVPDRLPSRVSSLRPDHRSWLHGPLVIGGAWMLMELVVANPSRAKAHSLLRGRKRYYTLLASEKERERDWGRERGAQGICWTYLPLGCYRETRTKLMDGGSDIQNNLGLVHSRVGNNGPDRWLVDWTGPWLLIRKKWHDWAFDLVMVFRPVTGCDQSLSPLSLRERERGSGRAFIGRLSPSSAPFSLSPASLPHFSVIASDSPPFTCSG